MASFLQIAESVGLDVLKVIAPAAGVAATTFGGPLAGAVATSVLNNIVTAEQTHLAAVKATPITPTAPAEPVVDMRKATVMSNVNAFLPVIELVAQITGHPIADKAAFEAALPALIDATVASLNAITAMYAALHGPVAAPAAA